MKKGNLKYCFLFYYVFGSIVSYSQIDLKQEKFQFPSYAISKNIGAKSFSNMIIGEISGDLYYLQQKKLLGLSFELYKCDSLMNPVDSISILSKRDGKSPDFFYYGVYQIKNRLYKITSRIVDSPDKGKLHQLELQFINPVTLQFEGESRIIESTKFNKGRSPLFFFSFSPDSSKIAICSFPETNVSGKIKSSVRVIDTDFNTIWKKETLIQKRRDMPFNTDHFYFEINNRGDLFLLSQNYGTEFVNKQDIDSIAYKLYCFTGNGIKEQEIDIRKPKGKSIYIPYLGSYQNDHVLLLGEYYQKETNEVGTYHLDINLENRQIKETKFIPINKSISNSNNAEYNPEDFLLKEVISSDDGFIYLFEYSHYKRGYTFGDLLLTKTDKYGNLLWIKNIHKYQPFHSTTSGLAYTSIYVNGNLYIIFNQYKGDRNGYFTCITEITEDGALYQQNLFTNKDYLMSLSDGRLFNKKSYSFAISEKKNGWIHLLKLDFNNLRNHGLPIHSKDLIENENEYKHLQREHHKLKQRKHKKNRQGYLGGCLNYGISNYRSMNGIASVNFTYLETDIYSNHTTTKTAHLSQKFSSSALPLFGFGIEYARRFYYLGGRAELGTSHTSFATNTMGYGNVYLDGGFRYKFPKKNIGFRLGIMYLHNHIYHEIGRIDNSQKILTINNDNKFGSTFNVSGTRYHNDVKYDANYSQVGLDQTDVGITPKIGIEYHSKNTYVIYRLNIGYNYSLQSYYHIYIAQFNASHSVYNGHTNNYSIDSSFLNYSYSGNNNKNIPYNPNNLFFNFEIVLKGDLFSSPGRRR